MYYTNDRNVLQDLKMYYQKNNVLEKVLKDTIMLVYFRNNHDIWNFFV